MGQKPIHKRTPLETREAVWQAIRRLLSFTLRELRAETRCSRDQVREYVTGLLNAGYVAKQDESTFKLVRDCGVEAPRVRRDGSDITHGKAREQMWLVMKVLDDFSARDLAFHASTEEVMVDEIDAKNYIYFLHKAGYLIEVQAGKPGRRMRGTGTLARYRLLSQRYTGPRPPVIQRIKQVYDQNLKKVMWSAVGGCE